MYRSLDHTLRNGLLALSSIGLAMLLGGLVATPIVPATAAAAPAAAPVHAGADAEAVGEHAAAQRSPRRSRARSALATPYFSFANGLRGKGA